MKITVLRNLGPDLPNYKEGQVVEVDDDKGADLVKSGLAIQGIAKKPKITAPAPPEEENPVELDSGKSDTQKRFKKKGKNE